jgi:hypothetical protein
MVRTFALHTLRTDIDDAAGSVGDPSIARRAIRAWTPCAICPSRQHAAGMRACRVGQIKTMLPRIPPHEEGRFAIVTNVEAGSGGRDGSQVFSRRRTS